MLVKVLHIVVEGTRDWILGIGRLLRVPIGRRLYSYHYSLTQSPNS